MPVIRPGKQILLVHLEVEHPALVPDQLEFRAEDVVGLLEGENGLVFLLLFLPVLAALGAALFLVLALPFAALGGLLGGLGDFFELLLAEGVDHGEVFWVLWSFNFRALRSSLSG